jgi:hypothetical protein
LTIKVIYGLYIDLSLQNQIRLKKEGVHEENISTEQSQAEENPWLQGKNEHPRRSHGPEAEANEREKEAGGVNARCPDHG